MIKINVLTTPWPITERNQQTLIRNGVRQVDGDTSCPGGSGMCDYSLTADVKHINN